MGNGETLLWNRQIDRADNGTEEDQDMHMYLLCFMDNKRLYVYVNYDYNAVRSAKYDQRP